MPETQSPLAMPHELVSKMLKGDKRALARLITLVENNPEVRREVIRLLPRGEKRAVTVCITGPPGVGKSTLIDQIISILRERGKTVGLILIDPTSPFTGGALLGDRIRMQRHSTDPGVFIRSVSTRDDPEGASSVVKDLVRIMEAFGFDYVVVETAGAGQTGVNVANSCRTTVLVLMPYLGDDIQMMKAGFMEIADIYVINKSDLGGADVMESLIRANLVKGEGGWTPPVIKVSAYNRKSVEPVVEAIDEHDAHGDERRLYKTFRLLRNMVVEEVEERIKEWASRCPEFTEMVQRVMREEVDMYTALDVLLEEVMRELCENGLYPAHGHGEVAERDEHTAV